MKEDPDLVSTVDCSEEHKTLILEGYCIHYYLSGNDNNDVIVFLHPAFSDHRAFDRQIDFFSQAYKVITIDLIGHGLSKANKSKDKIDRSAEHINDILEIEGYEKTHLEGVSMGSLVAQYFALKYPDQTKSLTVLGGYDINKENKEVAKAQISSNIGLILRALFSMKAFRLKTAAITCTTNEGQALFYKSSRYYERKSFLVMQGFQKILKNRININHPYPTLILTGEFDIELARRNADAWHEYSNNCTRGIIPDAGHCANMDNPDFFNKMVLEFINAAN